MSVKLPKFKKLRQWSHDSIVNLSQLTIRSTNNNTKQKQHSENPLPTTGITTISSAIHEQKIDPKKDNFGLYALKCDRSRSLANARRGILLNLPSSKIKLDSNPSTNFQSVERNHEIFKSCEVLDEAVTATVKIEPPPRKKKKVLLSALHHKPKQLAYQQATKTGTIQSTTISMESLEKNDSGLYRIVGSTDTARITYVEPKKREQIIAVVKPKVEKAITVKSSPMPKPVAVAATKSQEMNRANQRRGSRGSLKKVHEVKKYTKFHSFDAAKLTKTDSIDIFKSNRIMDQKKLFDEFDALFEKNKAWEEKNETQSTAVAFEKLAELKRQSSSTFSSIESQKDDNKELIKAESGSVASQKSLARAKYVNSLLQDDDDIQDNSKENFSDKIKPKIISQQVKQHVEVNKKKIVYYDDESELQDMIMRRSQSKLLTMDVNVKESESQKVVETKHHPTPLLSTTKALTSTVSSNSLKIFSNEGDKIFVFNL